MREIHTQIFKFKYKGQFYRFERPYVVGVTDRGHFNWFKKCCKEVGADPKKITHKEMTFAHWNFSVGIIF